MDAEKANSNMTAVGDLLMALKKFQNEFDPEDGGAAASLLVVTLAELGTVSDMVANAGRFDADVAIKWPTVPVDDDAFTKYSTCTEEGGYRCNFTWAVPALGTGTAETRRKKLLAKVALNIGGVRLIVQHVQNETTQAYFLSWTFLQAYFAHVDLGKSPVHNMGCVQCSTCKEFHRLQHLAAASEKMRKDKSPTCIDWTTFFDSVASQCK